jgi:hypothetical protein
VAQFAEDPAESTIDRVTGGGLQALGRPILLNRRFSSFAYRRRQREIVPVMILAEPASALVHPIKLAARAAIVECLWPAAGFAMARATREIDQLGSYPPHGLCPLPAVSPRRVRRRGVGELSPAAG